MNITIIGTGFVGAVSAAVYASFGHQVIGLDIDQAKVDSLKKGKVPFYEPQLEELLIEQQKENRLSFTTDYQEAVSEADLVIVAVGTPSKPSGAIDLSYVEQACSNLAPYLQQNAVVVIKSTVPPGVFKTLHPIISEKTNKKFYLAALPEFLKEGTAVDDTLNPDRVVIGSEDKFAVELLTKLHQPLQVPLVVIKPESAQMVKYAANAYLATRITFINQIADLCEHAQADILDVIEGIGYDRRIGHHYWYPGPGYGGSCFPKDVNELADFAKRVGEKNSLIITISQLNEQRIARLLNKYEKMVGGWDNLPVAILGLSFKPNTNDTREAPAGKIVPPLLKMGAKIKAFDPKAVWEPEKYQARYQQLDSIASAITGAKAIFALVEWPKILKFKFPSTKKPVFFFDTRNQFDPEKISRLGYTYQGIGR